MQNNTKVTFFKVMMWINIIGGAILGLIMIIAGMVVADSDITFVSDLPGFSLAKDSIKTILIVVGIISLIISIGQYLLMKNTLAGSSSAWTGLVVMTIISAVIGYAMIVPVATAISVFIVKDELIK